jgi:hypothetical protein
MQGGRAAYREEEKRVRRAATVRERVEKLHLKRGGGFRYK